MIVVIIILVPMWLMQVVFLQDVYEFTKEHDVKKVQKNIVAVLSREGSLAENYNEILDIAADNELYIEIYDAKANSILNPFMLMDKNRRVNVNDIMSHYATNAIIEQMQEGNKATFSVKLKQQSGENNGALLIIVDRFELNGKHYYVSTRASLVPVQATSDILSRIFFIILAVVFVAAIVAAIIFASSITRPIRKVSEAANAVAGGDYTVKLPEETEDEMGMLMRDFNNMTLELSKVDALRKDLIANVSHELRTPLTMIKGYAETIRDLTGSNPEKREKQLDIIIDESDRLSGLITNMLDLSRLQAGKVEFHKTDVNISEMIKALLVRYDIFTDAGYEIKQSIADGVYCSCDENRIEQVICNLTDNAINHSVETKIVTVTLEESGLLKIHNYGDVIEPENIPHIWDRYYKVDKTGNRRVTGTGIGLSIVKEILVAHGFKFGVTSDETNGTTFWVKF